LHANQEKNRTRLIIAICIILPITCVCGLVILAGAVYGLSIVVDSFRQLQEYTAQGGTCSAMVVLPLGAVGLAMSRYRSGK
jgi:hypothetical protein